MAFVDLQNFSTPPKRICGAPKGHILDVFPPSPIDAHSRLGYSYRGEPCNSTELYNPDVCVTGGDAKMTPDEYGTEKDAELRVLQSAFKCSTLGSSDEDLVKHAREAIERNLWRSVDTTLEGMLDAEDVPQGGAFSASCVLAEAAQFLATSSYCGTGIIYGSTSWFSQLTNILVISDDGFYRDLLGNIIVPSSLDLSVVYAFDSEVEVRTSGIELLDDYSPGIRTVNDKVVRAEMVYTVAVDNCAVGSWTLTACT